MLNVRANYWSHVIECFIPYNLMCNMTHILKRLILYKPMRPLRRAQIWSQGQNLNKPGRSTR